MEKSNGKNMGLVIVLIALVAAGYIYYNSRTKTTPVTNSDEQVFCTQDALECPDGSFVGRVAPTCEFAACPGAN